MSLFVVESKKEQGTRNKELTPIICEAVKQRVHKRTSYCIQEAQVRFLWWWLWFEHCGSRWFQTVMMAGLGCWGSASKVSLECDLTNENCEVIDWSKQKTGKMWSVTHHLSNAVQQSTLQSHLGLQKNPICSWMDLMDRLARIPGSLCQQSQPNGQDNHSQRRKTKAS